MIKRTLCILLFSALGLCACETMEYSMRTPDGFAKFDKEKTVLKYVSSDGVRVRSRSIPNEPYGDMEMWSSTVRNYLQSQGYHLRAAKELATPDNIQGRYSEYNIRYNAEDYIYAVALYVDRERIYIIETGGIRKYYDRRKNSVLQAIRSFQKGRN